MDIKWKNTERDTGVILVSVTISKVSRDSRPPSKIKSRSGANMALGRVVWHGVEDSPLRQKGDGWSTYSATVDRNELKKGYWVGYYESAQHVNLEITNIDIKGGTLTRNDSMFGDYDIPVKRSGNYFIRQDKNNNIVLEASINRLGGKVWEDFLVTPNSPHYNKFCRTTP